MILSGCPYARLSSVAETPPSTEFSIGTRAAATSPSRTAWSACATVAYGVGSSGNAGSVSRAW